MAISLDRYNPNGKSCSHTSFKKNFFFGNLLGLVNKGCCFYSLGQYERALEFFQEALNVEATCCEALYNLGLVYKKLGRTQNAMETFVKLHAILRNSPLVLWHLADLYDKMGDFEAGIDWLAAPPIYMGKVGF